MAGAKESDVISPNLTCTYCGDSMYEDKATRQIGRKCEVTVCCENDRDYFVEHGLEVVVRDDLLDSLQLGLNHYSGIICVKESSSPSYTVFYF